MLWKSDIPTEEGWYWLKYNGKNGVVICPAQVIPLFKGRMKDTVIVSSARNDQFISGPNHGGKGLTYGGKPCPDVMFGDKIEEPND